MMRRLCFLCSDVEIARAAVADLRDAGLADSEMSLIARPDTPLDGLPAAGIGKTDALPGFTRGVAAGAVIGALAGAVSSTVAGFAALGTAAIALFALFGALVSGLAGLFAGAAVPSSRLWKFRSAIEQDKKVLLLVSVSLNRADEIGMLIQERSPDIQFAGVEPRATLIPR